MFKQASVACRALISGRVQGVCFRAAAKIEADRQGLNGWVKNLPDGSVECLVYGRQEQIKIFLGWLRQGPPGAQVKAVKYKYYSPTGQFDNFVIVYD